MQIGIEKGELRISGAVSLDQAEATLTAALEMVRQHKARPPLPIPVDFDVEKETLRARQGGCCHGGTQ